MDLAFVFDYLAWRGDLGFEEVSANEGDRLILSLMSFADFSGIVSGEISPNGVPLCEAIEGWLSKSEAKSQNMRDFMVALQQSRRFRSLRLCGYRSQLKNESERENQTQFSALSVLFSDHVSVVYRGTDNSLVGWKENFNALLLHPIPAQAMAASYLTEVMALDLPIALQGHSKGGNLAVYAAAASDVPTERILRVNDYDGPGFSSEFFQTDRYQQLRPKIHKYLPEYSVIGLLRESDCEMHIVKSSGRGIFQHNGFHFQFTAAGLEPARRLDVNAVLLGSRLKRCLAEMSLVRREQVIEGIYRLLSCGGRETLAELASERRKLLHDFQRMDESDKEAMKWVVQELFGQLFLHTKELRS